VKRILVIEDDADIRANMKDLLEVEGFEVLEAADGIAGVELAEARRPELVLCDITMPGADGYTVLQTLRERRETAFIPFVFLSARASRADVRMGMELGADDYLTKPFSSAELLSAIRTRLRRVDELAQPKHEPDPELQVKAIVRSPAHREVYRRALRAAAAPVAILVQGETGVGKEILARAIHDASPRAGKPFVPLHCAALAESVLEGELFGHVKGAFTGAVHDKIGHFEAADGGTVFLDEVGELPPSIQVKLLRVLENKTVLPVGGRTPRTVDVRFVSATNADLAALPGFREDLRYRINGVTVRIPPLRERPEEIVPLAEHFMERAARLQGRRPPTLSPGARQALLSYRWPGNVRELKNAMESAFCLGDGEISVTDLPYELGGEEPVSGPAPTAKERLADQMRALQRQEVMDALEACGGNQTRAAVKLRISRRKLVYLLNEYGFPRPRKGA
jgi:DNA-binding NtrC family response regulator